MRHLKRILIAIAVILLVLVIAVFAIPIPPTAEQARIMQKFHTCTELL